MGKSCCFIGHREIEITDELTNRLTVEIEQLIRSGVSRFLFGSRSDFNSHCHTVVTRLKTKYPHIQRIAYDTKSESSVLEENREAEEHSLSRLLKREIRLAGYEAVNKPDVVYGSGRASYIERNQIMIDNSDICVFYFDENYTPKQRQISNKYVGGIWTSPNSGTAIAYRYAQRRRKTIINLFAK